MALRPVFLDTDILIDHLRGDGEATRLIEALEGTSLLLTTTVTVFELYYGAHRTRRSVEGVQAIRRLLERMSVVGVDGDAAEKAGEIAAGLERVGVPMGFGDVLIGAVVLVNNGELLTRNTRHFERIPGLRLVKS